MAKAEMFRRTKLIKFLRREIELYESTVSNLLRMGQQPDDFLRGRNELLNQLQEEFGISSEELQQRGDGSFY